jgi:DNA-binding transcriptional regulator YiaG
MKSKKESLGRRVVRELTEFVEAAESGRDLSQRYTVRVVHAVPAPGRYDARRVKATRRKLNASQAVMAGVLGVSVKLVQAWEQETREPSGPVRRLLDEINRRPNDFIAMIPLTDNGSSRAGLPTTTKRRSA